MHSFIDSIKRHTAAQDGTRSHPVWGLVVSYNPTDCTARIQLQPENTITGWLPVSYPTTGNGTGIICPPVAGQQVLVCFEGGSLDDGVILGGSYSLQNRAPTIAGASVQSGEVAIFNPNGSYTYWKANGDININTSSNVNITAATVTITGNLNVSGDVHVGSEPVSVLNHTHGGVQTGSGNTAKPN